MHPTPCTDRGTTRRAMMAGLLALAVAGTACAASVTGSGQRTSEARSVGAFEAIDVAGPIKLIVRQAQSVAVTIEADDNVAPLIVTEVVSRGGRDTLRVRPRPGESLRRHGPIVATVDVVKLEAVSMSGSGDVEVGTLQTPSLKLSLSGSSDAVLNGLTTEKFDASISGSGDIRASGQARDVRLSIAGSGDANLAELTADTVKVSIAGSGDVRYAGNATDVRSSIAGSGNVRRR